MIKIQTITVPTKGEGNLFQLKSNGFVIGSVNPQPVSCYWQVFASEEVEGVLTPTVCVIDGNITMPSEIYNEWGTNDGFVIDWACDQLGFTII